MRILVLRDDKLLSLLLVGFSVGESQQVRGTETAEYAEPVDICPPPGKCPLNNGKTRTNLFF
jgi:hypothetical protein